MMANLKVLSHHLEFSRNSLLLSQLFQIFQSSVTSFLVSSLRKCYAFIVSDPHLFLFLLLAYRVNGNPTFSSRLSFNRSLLYQQQKCHSNKVPQGYQLDQIAWPIPELLTQAILQLLTSQSWSSPGIALFRRTKCESNSPLKPIKFYSTYQLTLVHASSDTTE